MAKDCRRCIFSDLDIRWEFEKYPYCRTWKEPVYCTRAEGCGEFLDIDSNMILDGKIIKFKVVNP